MSHQKECFGCERPKPDITVIYDSGIHNIKGRLAPNPIPLCDTCLDDFIHLDWPRDIS